LQSIFWYASYMAVFLYRLYICYNALM